MVLGNVWRTRKDRLICRWLGVWARGWMETWQGNEWMDKLMHTQKRGWMGGEEEGSGRKVGHKNGCSKPKVADGTIAGNPPLNLRQGVRDAPCHTLRTYKFCGS